VVVDAIESAAADSAVVETAATTSADTAATNTTGTATGSAQAQLLRQLNQVGKNRNIAIMNYNIEEESDSGWASSGPDFNGSIPKPTDPFFDATPTGNNLRDADSEYKLLNWLAQRFNPAGVPKSDFSGTVDLYTERPPCSSCSNVIDEFRRMFRLIELNVTDGP
jgi:hypothetical protein